RARRRESAPGTPSRQSPDPWLAVEVVADAECPGCRQDAVEASGEAVTPGLVLDVELEGVAATFAALQREPGRRRERCHERAGADRVEDAQIELAEEAEEMRRDRRLRTAHDRLLATRAGIADPLVALQR